MRRRRGRTPTPSQDAAFDPHAKMKKREMTTESPRNVENYELCMEPLSGVLETGSTGNVPTALSNDSTVIGHLNKRHGETSLGDMQEGLLFLLEQLEVTHTAKP